MRPRVFPAEDMHREGYDFEGAWASMRPRVFPAEDLSGIKAPIGGTLGFNEAAGIPRGRRRQGGSHAQRTSASMRPRVFPAEDSVNPSPAGC